MATSSQFEQNSTYTFTTHNPTYLGTFENVVATGIVGIDTAALYGDVVVTHMNILPHLPDGSERDPSKLSYLLIKGVDGNIRPVGLPWIISNTVVEVHRNKIVVEIEDVGPDDVEKISMAIKSRGYGGRFTVKLI